MVEKIVKSENGEIKDVIQNTNDSFKSKECKSV